MAMMVNVITLVALLTHPMPGAETLQIGSRLELFVDDWLIDSMSDSLQLKLHAPRPAEVVLQFDRPWETRWSASGYGTVFQDGNRYRLYYRAGLAEFGEPEFVCYAQSTDGIHWEKPDLNLIEFQGSKKNNIVWDGVGSPHALGVFKDTNPSCRPTERYKALSSDGYRKPVYAYGSPDGIRWHLIQEEPVIDEHHGAVAAYDSQFCTRWDPVERHYVVYHRIWYRPVDNKVRSIAVRTSADFIHWTPLKRLDFGDTSPEHLYTNAIGPYFRSPHILLGFPRRFWPTRRKWPEPELDGISDTAFISSRDGLHFDRRFMESYIRPGGDRLSWLTRCNTVLPGMLQLSRDELSLYVARRWGDPTVHVRRYVLRTDGFVSVNASYAGGQLVTKPFVFKGRELVMNYATSAAGSVRVALAGANGRAIPGFALENCPEIYGDEVEHVVRWTGQPDLARLVGRPVRLHFQLKDADLYSIRFRTP